MSFWRKISPARAAKDFAHEFQRPNPHRWPIIGVSAAVTVAIFSVIWQEEVRGPPPRPEVTYITSWRADRDDAEIIASNIRNQERKDALAAQRRASEERIREMYKTLGRVSGMDVDRIEREAMAERAAEERAKAQREAEREGAVAP